MWLSRLRKAFFTLDSCQLALAPGQMELNDNLPSPAHATMGWGQLARTADLGNHHYLAAWTWRATPTPECTLTG